MTRLDEIIASIEQNPAIVVVSKVLDDQGTVNTLFWRSPAKGAADFIMEGLRNGGRLEFNQRLIVAPKEPIYEAEALQRFMFSLVPQITGLKYPFTDSTGGYGFIPQLGEVDLTGRNVLLLDFFEKGGYLNFGWLQLMEATGTDIIRREIEVQDLSWTGLTGLDTRVSMERTTNIVRNLFVRPFPNERLARDISDYLATKPLVLSGNYLEGGEISDKDLRKYMGQGSFSGRLREKVSSPR